MINDRNDTTLIMVFNFCGVIAAYVLLAISLYLSTDVPLSTKGYWGMGVLLLTFSLVNLVKYRFDTQVREDRIARIEAAKNEKMLEELISEGKN